MTRLTATEHGEQSALMEWAAKMAWKFPDLKMLFAVPNQGAGLNKRLQMEGVKAGVPDLLLLCPHGSFHGLALEMKIPGGRVSPAQQEFLQELRARGYCTAVCVGWDAAREVIENYLRMKEII